MAGWRDDNRCGAGSDGVIFTAPGSGVAAECNPSSGYPCCSKYGHCGPSRDHCVCVGCIDYRLSPAARAAAAEKAAKAAAEAARKRIPAGSKRVPPLDHATTTPVFDWVPREIPPVVSGQPSVTVGGATDPNRKYETSGRGLKPPYDPFDPPAGTHLKKGPPPPSPPRPPAPPKLLSVFSRFKERFVGGGAEGGTEEGGSKEGGVGDMSALEEAAGTGTSLETPTLLPPPPAGAPIAAAPLSQSPPFKAFEVVSTCTPPHCMPSVCPKLRSLLCEDGCEHAANGRCDDGGTGAYPHRTPPTPLNPPPPLPPRPLPLTPHPSPLTSLTSPPYVLQVR